MPHTVEFYFDFRSPYSYMAYSQLARMEVEVVLKPMVILKVMEQVGNVPTTLTCSAKARYARVDLGRWAQRYGIPLNPTDMKAVDGEACLRAVLAAGSAKDAATITESPPRTEYYWVLTSLASALLLIEIGLTVRDLRRTRLSDRAGR